MFKVNKESKKLEQVTEISFKEINCKERKDLQEWIVSNPTILGEDLLIIQKEFSGFENTNERLDLLALDKDSNLVIIENKTDDTGRDVVWQAIKYASYCSSLSTSEITQIFKEYSQKYNLDLDIEKEILDFYEIDSLDSLVLNKENTQRIILVAKKFRKEVLSAVNWLINYGVNILCIEITPFKAGNDVFLDHKQIIPIKGMEENIIRLAEKNKEFQNKEKTLARSKNLRSRFWEKLIPLFNKKSDLYANISYVNRRDGWLSATAGITGGLHYNFLIGEKYCGVELCINDSDIERNKKIYDCLYSYKDEIITSFGNYNVAFERLDNCKMSRVIVKNYDLSLYNEESWDEIIEYLIPLMMLFNEVFKKYSIVIKKLSK